MVGGKVALRKSSDAPPPFPSRFSSASLQFIAGWDGREIRACVSRQGLPSGKGGESLSLMLDQDVPEERRENVSKWVCLGVSERPPPVAADCPNVTGHTSLSLLALLPLSETNLKCIFLRSVAHSSHAQDCLTCFGVGTQQHSIAFLSFFPRHLVILRPSRRGGNPPMST